MSASVAFLGTGIMGRPMAANLARAGHRVTVWNRTPAKAAGIAGVAVATDACAAARSAEVAVVMVSTGAVADALLFDDGVADAMAAGSCVVVMSSIAPSVARAQAARLTERGVGYVDAPVSGGERGAVEATLTIMAGGTEADVAAVAPLLGALGRVTRVGPAGAGQLAKLANQLIVGVTIGAVAEALLLAEAGGADPAAVRAALLGGFADSTILREHGDRMIERRFEPGAHAATQLKDLATAQAETAGAALPFLALAREWFERMSTGPRAALDHSALYLELREAMR